MEIWKTLRVSHIPTPPATTTNYGLTKRYTNIPLGTKDRSDQNLLKRYPKAIAHMHWRNSVQRLGLVFGAGASRDLGFPTWEKLVRRIAQSPEVDGSALVPRELRKPLPIV